MESTFRKLSRLAALAFVAGVVGVIESGGIEAAGPEASQREPYGTRIGVNSGPAPWGVRVAADIEGETWMANAYEDANGKPWATGVLAYQRAGPAVHYPLLAQGDILPMFGFLYRVTSIIDHGPEAWKVERYLIKLKWIKPEDWPPGVTIQPDSVTIPLRQREEGRADLYGAFVYVEAIEPSKADSHGGPVAEIRVVPSSSQAEATTVRVGPGDLLQIRPVHFQVRFRVRNVVPRDEKQSVIGWVELDPKPLQNETTGAEEKGNTGPVEPPPPQG